MEVGRKRARSMDEGILSAGTKRARGITENENVGAFCTLTFGDKYNRQATLIAVELLTRQSPVFKDLIDSQYSKVQSPCIELRRVNADVFAILQHWLLYGTMLPESFKYSAIGNLAVFWQVCRDFKMPRGQNAAMAALLKSLSSREKFEWDAFIKFNMVLEEDSDANRYKNELWNLAVQALSYCSGKDRDVNRHKPTYSLVYDSQILLAKHYDRIPNHFQTKLSGKADFMVPNELQIGDDDDQFGLLEYHGPGDFRFPAPIREKVRHFEREISGVQTPRYGDEIGGAGRFLDQEDEYSQGNYGIAGSTKRKGTSDLEYGRVEEGRLATYGRDPVAVGNLHYSHGTNYAGNEGLQAYGECDTYPVDSPSRLSSDHTSLSTIHTSNGIRTGSAMTPVELEYREIHAVYGDGYESDRKERVEQGSVGDSHVGDAEGYVGERNVEEGEVEDGHAVERHFGERPVGYERDGNVYGEERRGRTRTLRVCRSFDHDT